MFAEIHAPDFGVVHDLGGGAFGEHLAFADDVGMVADAQGLAHIVVGNEHPDAARFQEVDDALDLDHRNRVNAGKRLVEQNETWACGQSACNLDAPALAARQRQRRRQAQVLDPQVVKEGGQAGFDFRALERLPLLVALQFQHGAHVFFDVQLAKNGGFLRQVAQPQARSPVNRHVLNRLPIDGDVAGAGMQQAHDHVERSRLPGTVGAEQAHHLSGAHRQRHVFHHLALAVRLLQVARHQRALTGPVTDLGGCRHVATCGPAHLGAPPRAGVTRSGAGPLPFAAEGTADASGLGVSMARTRPAGAPATPLLALPSTLKTSRTLS